MDGGAWMWNPKCEELEDDDESWEVKASEQDTKSNISGTTWPPRSYTCNFCRREFRSAQSLCGHMNVHRRDRATKARHQGPTDVPRNGSDSGGTMFSSTFSSSVRPIIIQSTVGHIEGLSHFYQFQNPNGSFGNSGDIINLYGTTSFPSSNLTFSLSNPPVEFPSRLIEYLTTYDERIDSVKERTGTSVDEPDLELRLGHNPP